MEPALYLILDAECFKSVSPYSEPDTISPKIYPAYTPHILHTGEAVFNSQWREKALISNSNRPQAFQVDKEVRKRHLLFQLKKGR